MADTDTTTGCEGFFTYVGMFNLLAAATKQHAPDVYQEAADYLCGDPARTIAGLAFAQYQLAQVEEKEITREHLNAQAALSELTALVARMMRYEAEAEYDKMMAETRAAAN